MRFAFVRDRKSNIGVDTKLPSLTGAQALAEVRRLAREGWGFSISTFRAVEKTERRQTKTQAPADLRQPSDIFILAFIIRGSYLA